MAKKKIRLKVRAKNKRAKLERKNESLSQKSASLQTQPKTKKPSKATLKATKSLGGRKNKLFNDFVNFSLNHSTLKGELEPLWDTLKRMGITPNKFFQMLDLEKFLKAKPGYRTGGRVNEILLLHNKPFVDFLIDLFAEKAFKGLLELIDEGRKNPKINTKWKILNSKDKNLSNLELDNFKKLETEVLDSFRTGKADPKIEYLDGALAKFDAKSNMLLIEVALQLKSPRNVVDLLQQLAETLGRLKREKFVSFQKDGKLFIIPTENVFILSGESLGIFYGDVHKSFDQITITAEAGDIIKTVDVRPKFTSGSDPEFFQRIKVQYKHPKLYPNNIEKILEKIKADFLKKQKTRKMITSF